MNLQICCILKQHIIWCYFCSILSWFDEGMTILNLCKFYIWNVDKENFNVNVLKCGIRRLDLWNLSLKVMLKSKWLCLVLDVNFMTLTILNRMYIFYIPWIHYKFAVIIMFIYLFIVENHWFNLFLLYFKQYLDTNLFKIIACTAF